MSQDLKKLQKSYYQITRPQMAVYYMLTATIIPNQSLLSLTLKLGTTY